MKLQGQYLVSPRGVYLTGTGLGVKLAAWKIFLLSEVVLQGIASIWGLFLVHSGILQSMCNNQVPINSHLAAYLDHLRSDENVLLYLCFSSCTCGSYSVCQVGEFPPKIKA